MALIWAVQQRTADAGIVDVGGAAGIGVLALAYAYTGSGLDQRRLLVGLLGGIWSFRLSTYLIIDRVRAKAEDGRYRMLRQSWSDRAPLHFFLFFQAQALLVVIFSLPFFLAAQNPTILSLWDGLGVLLPGVVNRVVVVDIVIDD